MYIGRGSPWGNPFRIGQDGMTREQVIERYREWVRNGGLGTRSTLELRGKDLVCWCAPLPCHGDVLLELANGCGHD